jgi:ABC-type transporter Mla maintaining outer membrane lipid asymmetry permease subunit MlaE
MRFHGYARLSNSTRWLHNNQDWTTSTIGWAVFSVGAVRCYTGMIQHEVSQSVSKVTGYSMVMGPLWL